MPIDDRPVLVAPCKVAVELTCPNCGAIYTIPASIGARVTRDSDGAGFVALRVNATKTPHLCGQMELELVGGEGVPREPGGPDDGA